MGMASAFSSANSTKRSTIPSPSRSARASLTHPDSGGSDGSVLAGHGRPLSKSWEVIPAGSVVESAPGAGWVAPADGDGEPPPPAPVDAVHDARISAAPNPNATRPA